MIEPECQTEPTAELVIDLTSRRLPERPFTSFVGRIAQAHTELLLAFGEAAVKREQELLDDARIDAKTGLANELKLAETFEALRTASTDANRRTAVERNAYLMAIDLDNFGEVNKAYGHAAGDEALAIVGDILKANVRKRDEAGRLNATSDDEDEAGRLHGDEMAVLLIGITPERAQEVAENIRAGIEAATGPAQTITASIGISPVDYEYSFKDNLIRADFASLEAKRKGKNQVIFVEA